jgi:hypothetical protein
VRIANESAGEQFRVDATYADMDGARRAIEALQFGGVEASRIYLMGEGAEEAARVAGSRLDSSASDRPILSRIVWRTVWWSIVGGVVGVGVGLFFGLSGFGGIPGMSNSVALQVASWGMFLHIAGAILGAYAGVSMGSAWELTFQPIRGRVIVAVRERDEKSVERAERIMRGKSPLSIARPSTSGD